MGLVSIHDDLVRIKSEQDVQTLAIVSIRNDIASIKSQMTTAGEERKRLMSSQEELLRLYETGKIWTKVLRYLFRMFWYMAIGIGGYVLSHWSKVRLFIEGDGKP